LQSSFLPGTKLLKPINPADAVADATAAAHAARRMNGKRSGARDKDPAPLFSSNASILFQKQKL
jgi:hypothetical protein